ncbi:hypothetical protein PF007_g269 [Phytophthora fragariae]|uniref:Uncharacterized protein n=2 Tax=Phytophthora fragariae TaxID=53985 RepID=A0A6A3TS78_9STRA|nr:hypothetical protein PF007_g269 [Phytophthora fragariae]
MFQKLKWDLVTLADVAKAIEQSKSTESAEVPLQSINNLYFHSSALNAYTAISFALSKLIVEFDPSVTTSSLADCTMDLLDAIRQDVLKQKEEETVNFFSKVSEIRTFIAVAGPGARRQHHHEDVLPCGGEAQRGQRHTGKKAFASKANLRFRPSGLYEFRQVDGVMFYADIPSGRVQYDRGAPDKIVEVPPPPNKRKSPRESPAKKKGKGKLREANLDIDVDDVGELDGDSGHDLGASADAMDESCGSIRTRSSVAPPA